LHEVDVEADGDGDMWWEDPAACRDWVGSGSMESAS